MHRPTRLKVTDINQHFTCVLCDGYLIDATTIVECLHSFCRTCIVRYLENSRFCPVCDVQVHKTKPLQSIKSDATLQDIVYKLVPGLYQNEMQRRREFYNDHPEAAAKCSSEERGEGADQRCFYSPQESISLTLEYMNSHKESKTEDAITEQDKKDPMTRYLNCPAALTVANLKKFIRMKFGVPPAYIIDVLYADNLLSDEYTLMDIAYIYTWRRAGPMKFLYTISNSCQRKSEALIPKHSAAVESNQTTIISNVPICDESVACDKPIDSNECEKMEIDDSSTREINASSNNGDLKHNTDNETVSSTVSDSQSMDISETEVPFPNISDALKSITSPKEVQVTSAVQIIPQNIKIVTTPQHAVISSANSLKLKFVQLSEPTYKARTKKVGGKKGGRGSRNKTVSVQRLARLAPHPPRPSAPPTACIAASSMTPLSQITVGKLVPSVMNNLAPNLMTALVSTTANSLCSSSTNTSLQPSTSFLGQVTTCNVVTCNVTTFSNSFSPSLSNSVSQKSSSTDTKLTSSVSSSNFINSLPNSHVFTIPAIQNPVNILPSLNNATPTITTGTVNIKTTSSISVNEPTSKVSFTQQSSQSGNNLTIAISTAANMSTPSSLPVISVLSDLCKTQSNTSTVSPDVHSVSQNSKVLLPVTSVMKESSSKVEDKTEKTLSLSADPTSNDHPNDAMDTVEKIDNVITSDSVTNDEVLPSPVQSNPIETTAPHKTLTTDSILDTQISMDKSSDSFEKGVKNSMSAEFSDNDDLGCQPDLVVDEHKMDSSDNEDETDVALREKITAIAEKEDEADATDDTEADSGRASDISNQARSSGEDDVGSPMPNSTTEADQKTATTTSNTQLPSLTVSTTTVSENSNRNAKSNHINHVINNLYRNHEKKDNIGALDLSTCTRKVGDPNVRAKPVANPVLDIKHKQPSYLGAASKQHTACVPAPKHPTSSPILMHGLTARHPLLPSQLHGKTPHIPVSPFHSPSLVFPSQSRAISTSSCTPGRSTPTYTSHPVSPPVPTAHQAMSPLLTGILPCMNNALLSSFSIRSPVTLPARSPTHLKSVSSPPSNLHSKAMHNSPHHGKPILPHSRKSSPSLDSHHAKSLTTPNNRNGLVSTVVTPGTQASYPKTSTSNLRISPLHRSASPAPSPKPMVPTLSASSVLPTTSTYKSSQSSIPIYKRSDSFKSYNCKFKGSNLAVINPDPNGYRQKIVIRNLDVKPNNHHSQK